MTYSKSTLKMYSLALLGVIGMALLIHFTLSSDVVPDAPDAGIYDFVYYIVIFRDYLQGTIASPYRLEAQRASMSALYQTPITSAMPVAVTPTALLIWGPFAWLATFSIPLANTIWLTCSLSALLFSWLRVAQYLMTCCRGRIALFGLTIYIGFVSATMYTAAFHGQTSVLACALFTLLVIETFRARQDGTPPRRWLFYLVFFCLSLKITYLALAALFVYVMGFRSDAIRAAIVVVGITLLVSLSGGVELLVDYMAQLTLYSSLDLPTYYAPALPLHMNNFTGAWHHILGRRPAAHLSQVIFAVSALALMGISYLKARSSAEWLRPLTHERLGLLCFGLFLIFMPHLGAYEELGLIVVFITALMSRTAMFPDGFEFLRRPGIFSNLVLLFVLLNHKVFGFTSLLWFLWLIKVWFVGSLCYRTAPGRLQFKNP